MHKITFFISEKTIDPDLEKIKNSGIGISIKSFKSNFYGYIEFHADTIDKDMNLKFKSFEEFPSDKDFIITVDNIKYRISHIYWKKDTIKAAMGDSWRIIKYVDSLKINGKIYNSYLNFVFLKKLEKIKRVTNFLIMLKMFRSNYYTVI